MSRKASISILKAHLSQYLDAVKAGDVGSFKRPVAATSGMVEQLTFTWMSHGADMGHLVLEWENTKVEIPVHKGGM